MIFDIEKFSISQMTSNNDGKTSGSGVIAICIAFTGLLTFFIGVLFYIFVEKQTEIMSQSVVLITLGTGLIGYRKSKEVKLKE